MRTERANCREAEGPARIWQRRRAQGVAIAGRTRGFSLPELLIVIAIVALLIALLFPTVSRSWAAVHRARCASNLRQIAIAFTQYARENNEFLPASAQYDPHLSPYDWIWYQRSPLPPARPIADVGRSPIVRLLGGNTSVLVCPSDSVATHRWPSGKASGPYPFSYVMNANLDLARYKVRLTAIRDPSACILAVEEEEQSLNDGNWNCGTNLKGGDRDIIAIRHDIGRLTETDPRTQDFTTHPNGQRRGNVVFCDGHVDFLSRIEAHDKKHTMPK